MIITDEQALRVNCEDVIEAEVSSIVEALEKELTYANKLGKGGIGLAAPQIGINKKVAIIRINKEFSVNLINAKIEKAYDLELIKQEGCLSFPGRTEDTNRYQEIYVVNNLSYPNLFIATGLFALACQHEIDHYNGILFIDRKIKKIVKTKAGPNDPCPCGKIDLISGKIKKFKKCCGKI